MSYDKSKDKGTYIFLIIVGFVLFIAGIYQVFFSNAEMIIWIPIGGLLACHYSVKLSKLNPKY